MLAIGFASFFLVIAAWAQETSQITARLDQSNAVIARANVGSPGSGHRVKWELKTNGDGYYTQAF